VGPAPQLLLQQFAPGPHLRARLSVSSPFRRHIGGMSPPVLQTVWFGPISSLWVGLHRSPILAGGGGSFLTHGDYYLSPRLLMGVEGVDPESCMCITGCSDFNNLIRATHLWLPNLILRHVYKKRFFLILSQSVQI
jgi:hypothetical protein